MILQKRAPAVVSHFASMPRAAGPARSSEAVYSAGWASGVQSVATLITPEPPASHPPNLAFVPAQIAAGTLLAPANAQSADARRLPRLPRPQRRADWRSQAPQPRSCRTPGSGGCDIRGISGAEGSVARAEASSSPDGACGRSQTTAPAFVVVVGRVRVLGVFSSGGAISCSRSTGSGICQRSP